MIILNELREKLKSSNYDDDDGDDVKIKIIYSTNKRGELLLCRPFTSLPQLSVNWEEHCYGSEASVMSRLGLIPSLFFFLLAIIWKVGHCFNQQVKTHHEAINSNYYQANTRHHSYTHCLQASVSFY